MRQTKPDPVPPLTRSRSGAPLEQRPAPRQGVTAWTIQALLRQACLIASDSAIGDTRIAPCVIALASHRRPITLFIECTPDPASAECLATAIGAFLVTAQARAWVRLEQLIDQEPARRGGPRRDLIACSAGLDATGVAGGHVLLEVTRDATGVTLGLELVERHIGPSVAPFAPPRRQSAAGRPGLW